MNRQKKIFFGIDETSNSNYIKVNTYIDSLDISSNDNEAYKESFIQYVKDEIDRVKSKINYVRYESYFKDKSLIEILDFIISTRDENSKYFDVEDDNIYPLHQFFDWSEIYDHFSCFLIPYQDDLYLGFYFWDKQFNIKPKYKFIKISPYEIIEILEELLDSMV